MAKANKNSSKLIPLIISLIIIFGAKFIPAPWGLTDGGFQVLATLVGALIMWLTIAVDWTCLIILFSLCLTPGLDMSAVSAGSLGNNTILFCMLCFMLGWCLEKTGVSYRICIWFLTNKTAQKGPWYTLTMMFCAVYVIALFVSPVATAMLALPIYIGILKELGFNEKEGGSLPAVVIIGIAMSITFAVVGSPLSKAQVIVGMTSYSVYTGDVMEFMEYFAIGLPVSIICLAACLLIIRFFWKPDVSALRNVDYAALRQKLGPWTKAEKWAAGCYVFCIVCWIVPGLMRSISPEAYASFFSKINWWYAPIIAVVVLINVRTENGPVMDFKQAMKSVSWGTLLFVATIMLIGSLFSNENIGLTQWLSTTLKPVVSGMSPMVFLVAVLLIGTVLTNFISNTVAVAVMFAIAMPLIVGGVFGDAINAKSAAILITMACNLAFATPPSSPPVAIVCDSGWVDSKLMLKWGSIMAIVSLIISVAVGIPLGKLFIG